MPPQVQNGQVARIWLLWAPNDASWYTRFQPMPTLLPPDDALLPSQDDGVLSDEQDEWRYEKHGLPLVYLPSIRRKEPKLQSLKIWKWITTSIRLPRKWLITKAIPRKLLPNDVPRLVINEQEWIWPRDIWLFLYGWKRLRVKLHFSHSKERVWKHFIWYQTIQPFGKKIPNGSTQYQS